MSILINTHYSMFGPFIPLDCVYTPYLLRYVNRPGKTGDLFKLEQLPFFAVQLC